MRDLIVAGFIVATLPTCFRRPFIGLLVFTLLAYMRLQDLTWGWARYERWSRVFEEAFQRLHGQLARGEASLFCDYAATNPAEFFAVASEVFFEQPGRMADECPALYRELSGFYRVDPVAW